MVCWAECPKSPACVLLGVNSLRGALAEGNRILFRKNPCTNPPPPPVVHSTRARSVHCARVFRHQLGVHPSSSLDSGFYGSGWRFLTPMVIPTPQGKGRVRTWDGYGMIGLGPRPQYATGALRSPRASRGLGDGDPTPPPVWPFSPSWGHLLTPDIPSLVPPGRAAGHRVLIAILVHGYTPRLPGPIPSWAGPYVIFGSFRSRAQNPRMPHSGTPTPCLRVIWGRISGSMGTQWETLREDAHLVWCHTCNPHPLSLLLAYTLGKDVHGRWGCIRRTVMITHLWAANCNSAPVEWLHGPTRPPTRTIKP